LAAREVSQRGGGARRGSESERGIRRAVEPLWASRTPVAKPDPERAGATAGDGYGPIPSRPAGRFGAAGRSNGISSSDHFSTVSKRTLATGPQKAIVLRETPSADSHFWTLS